MTTTSLARDMVEALVRATLAVALIGVAGFCLFGYGASYELPGAEGLPFRILYGVVGSGALATVGWAALGKRWFRARAAGPGAEAKSRRQGVKRQMTEHG